MVLELIHNVTLLVTLALGLQMLARWLVRKPLAHKLAAGLLFGAAGVAGMMTPIHVAPGVFYDGRSVVLSAAGLFGGPVVAGIAAVTCGAYHIYLGGAGMIVGVLVIIEATALGIGLSCLWRLDERWVNWLRLWLFGLVVHAGVLALQLLLPEGEGWHALRHISPAVMVFYPLGFLLVARVFLEGERRRNAERSLRDSEAVRRAIISCSPLALYSEDRAGSVLTWNESAEQTFGWSEDELLGKPLPVVPEEKRDEYAAFREHVLAGESFMGVERTFRRKDGSLFPAREVVAPLRDSAGQPIGIFGAIEDITERKKIEEERARLEGQFRQIQKMDALGQMSAGVAHEFENYLAAIRGNAKLASAHLEKGHPAHESLEFAQQAVDEASKVTRSLLTFGRAMSPAKRVVELCGIVADAERLIRHAIPRSIVLEVNLHCYRSCYVNADRTQLHQVLLNLALNARDAMPKGGTLRIDVGPVESPAASPASARIAITDTGAGIPSRIRERIFEPFFTTKERGEGSGLGLSIVHGIVEEHGGQITVESEPGTGTTFHILLPLEENGDADADGAASSRQPRGHDELIVLGGMTPYLRGTLASVLQAGGYEVVQAGDEDTLRETISRRQGEIRLLIVDAAWSGLICMREIREREGGIPVIVLAGTGETDQAQPDKNTVVIREPFEVGGLASVVGDLLEKGKQET